MKSARDDGFDPDEYYGGPSKTRVKQDMHGLQDIGTQLLALSRAQLDGIGMESRLRAALREHGRMPTRESKRRHMQFIGRLIREGNEEESLRRAMDDIRAGTTRILADAERWREQLLEDDAAMTRWMEQYPDTVAQPLRTLIRRARKEMAELEAKAPEDSGAALKSKAYKNLFQSLRTMLIAASK